ncbi:MAG TPA: hypothetical protein VK858_10215, partial [Longimicrobiales bacterium]|nr:hypothetical protein [Longimicrobiales bacterium]
SLARPLNLYLDVRLAGSVEDLLTGAVSGGWAGAVLVGAGALAVALAAGLGWLLAGLRVPATAAPDRDGSAARAPGRMGGRRATGGREPLSPHRGGGSRSAGGGGSARLADRLRRAGAVLRHPRSRRAGAILLAAGLVAIPLRWVHPRGIVAGLPAMQLGKEQWRQMGRMLQERERFAREMAAASPTPLDTPGLLRGLGGRDVILGFVESYGTTVLEDPRYAPVVIPRLEAMERSLADAGLTLLTGRMVAPSQGGMSWLGHGSLLSGLWLENQLRYDLLLASDRTTLVDDFEAAGYRSVALMPAITLAWPEGRRFGYEEIYARKDIDYAGPPLNWVTMPDQFTWWFLEDTIRRKTDDPRPVFAELGLISSHAPWTPILTVLDDWSAVGDGSVFDRWADAGEAPRELWKDADRVREHYARSIGYAVDVLASWAAEFVDDGTLLIALGDHQPAPLITGEDAPRTVPVHVVSRDPEVVEPFRELGFVPGGVPDPEARAVRMDAFRSWFVDRYSDPVADTLLTARRSP